MRMIRTVPVGWLIAASAVFGASNPVSSPRAPVAYYVAPEGDDNHEGQTAQRPWRSLARVNSAELAPGDRVLFRRGGIWRGQLVPQSGTESAPITYGAYGEGPKPALLGSVAMDQPSDWQPAGPNLWQTASASPSGQNLLTADLLQHLAIYQEQGASARGRWTDGQYVVQCQRAGTSPSHIQLYVAPFRIQADTIYQLRFRAKATVPLKLSAPHVMANAAPWGSYAVERAGSIFAVGNERVPCVQIYRAAKTADDARLTFALGSRIPAGDELTIADLTLVPCRGSDPLAQDVGNIIFDHGAAWGVKRWAQKELKAELDYWYDPQSHVVTLFLAENPAKKFKSVELALKQHIVNQSGRSSILYENLALRYGAAHGIGGGSTHHITVRDCDISWIGGGHQLTHPNGKPVRFGNGMEFWGNAHDCLVERCRLWEIYDAALTNQNQGSVVQEVNIVVPPQPHLELRVLVRVLEPARGFARPITSTSSTTPATARATAGDMVSGPTRPDATSASTPTTPRRRTSTSATTSSAGQPMWPSTPCGGSPRQWPIRAVIRLDHNCWFQPEGTMIRLKGKSYTQAQFAAYQRATGQETHSLAADPQWADASKLDFHLRPGSPCIDAGDDLGVNRDGRGIPVPQGRAADIGAFEHRPGR